MDVEARTVLSKKEELVKNKAENTIVSKGEEGEGRVIGAHKTCADQMQVRSDSRVVSVIQDFCLQRWKDWRRGET